MNGEWMYRLMAARQFEAGIAAPLAARSFVASTLRGHGAHDVDDALLATSELATNAATHAHSPFEVRILEEDHMIRIEVEDDDGSLPQIQPGSSDRRGGRGLAIVASIASEWGVLDRAPAHGKVVWCLLPTVFDPD